MLPISDAGFVYGDLDTMQVHCPVHSTYSEMVFNAQAATYGIPSPPSTADAHGWFVQKSLGEAIAHAERRSKHLQQLANKHEMAVVGQRRTIDSLAEAFHVLNTAAHERGLSPLPAALFSSGPPAAPAPATSPSPTVSSLTESTPVVGDDDDMFAAGFSDLTASRSPLGPEASSAAPAPVQPSGLDERIKARDDSALWHRMEQLEAAEAAAGDEVVWGMGGVSADLRTTEGDSSDDEEGEGGQGGIMEIVEKEDSAGQLLRGQMRAVPGSGGGAVGSSPPRGAQPRQRPPVGRQSAGVVSSVLERISAAPVAAAAPAASATPAPAQAAADAPPARQSRFKQRMSQLRK